MTEKEEKPRRRRFLPNVYTMRGSPTECYRCQMAERKSRPTHVVHHGWMEGKWKGKKVRFAAEEFLCAACFNHFWVSRPEDEERPWSWMKIDDWRGKSFRYREDEA